MSACAQYARRHVSLCAAGAERESQQRTPAGKVLAVGQEGALCVLQGQAQASGGGRRDGGGAGLHAGFDRKVAADECHLGEERSRPGVVAGGSQLRVLGRLVARHTVCPAVRSARVCPRRWVHRPPDATAAPPPTPLARAAANLPSVDVLPPAGLTPLSILTRDWLVMTRGAADAAVARLRRPVRR